MSDDRWLDVAGAILDGSAVAWESLPGRAADDRVSVDELRLIADVAQAHRDSDPAAPSWGAFRLLERIGHGTFGDVFRARDTALDRDVALKLLDHAPDVSAEEARLLARVRHPNVVTVYGAAAAEGRYGIWMEFVRGRTLAELVREHGPLPWKDVARIGIDVCAALGAVHAAGLLHGDVKAQNVMREDGSRIVLMDFGTGRFAADPSTRLAGTPLYLAPEVLAGRAPDVRSDIYSAGVLLYYLLTGAYPVEGTTLEDVRQAHDAGGRVPLRRRHAGVPRRLAAIVERALQRDAATRWQKAEDLQLALSKFNTRRRRATLVAAALAIAGATGVAVIASRPRGRPVVFRTNDVLLVTDVETRTGDPALDAAAAYLLRDAITSSAHVPVAGRERAREYLAAGSATTPTFDLPVARQVAMRDPTIRGILVSAVERVPSGYQIRTAVFDVTTNAPFAQTTERAEDPGTIIAAIQRTGVDVGVELGRAGGLPAPFSYDRISTRSPIALQHYLRAMDASYRGPARADVAADELTQAIRLDPAFAAAHTMLALRRRAEHSATEALREAEQAARLSAGVTPVERAYAFGTVHLLRAENSVDPVVQRREHEASAAAYEVVVRIQPNFPMALALAVREFAALGNPAGEARLRADVEGPSPRAFLRIVQIAEAYARAGDTATAERYAALARANVSLAERRRLPYWSAWIDTLPAMTAWLRGDAATAATLVDALGASAPDRNAKERQYLAELCANLNGALGRSVPEERPDRPSSQSDVDPAAAELRAKAALSPISGWACARAEARSRVLLSHGATREAIDGLENATRLRAAAVDDWPAWIRARAALADAYRAAGRPEMADAVEQTLHQLQPVRR